MAFGRRSFPWFVPRVVVWLACVPLVGACLSAQPSASPTLSPPPVQTTRPAPTPFATETGAAGVLARVAPALAFVATETSTGSAFRIDERHVVTNAHVVRLSHASARVELAGAAGSTAAKVVVWDLIADLAVLELDEPGSPLSTPLLPHDDAPRPGDRVYLVGYPLANPNSPTTTITEGIVSGEAFEWIDGLTYHQTDAVIEDGQSDGVLVDAQGAFLGITGGSRGRFAIALDAVDAMARIRRMVDGEDVDGIEDRLLPPADPGAEKVTDVTVRHRADVHAWIVDGQMGDPAATISLTSDEPVGLFAMAAAGQLWQPAGPPGTDLEVKVSFDAPGPYMVKVEAAGAGRSTARIRSSVGLTPFVDVDDGRAIRIGQTTVGVADYAGDIDRFVLMLDADESVVVRSFTAAIDPALFIDRVGGTDPPISGHDSGGPLGGDDELTLTSARAGEYLVIVSDYRYSGAGAYRLSVERG